MSKLPTKEQYDDALDYFFRCFDESFTFGSDNEIHCDRFREEFDEMWCMYLRENDVAGHKEIMNLAYQLQDELYLREAIEEEYEKDSDLST